MKRIAIIGDAPGGNYIPTILRLAHETKLPRGALVEVVISHDEWCACLRYGRPCDCEPEVRMAWRDQ